MEVYIKSSWLVFLLGLFCLTITLSGVQGDVDGQGPTESECRPYIEKALKDLEAGEAENTEPLNVDFKNSNEELPTIEITTDDSNHSDSDNPDSIETNETEEVENVEEDDNDDDDNNEKESGEVDGDDDDESNEQTISTEEVLQQEEINTEEHEQSQETSKENNSTGENTENSNEELPIINSQENILQENEQDKSKEENEKTVGDNVDSHEDDSVINKIVSDIDDEQQPSVISNEKGDLISDEENQENILKEQEEILNIREKEILSAVEEGVLSDAEEEDETMTSREREILNSIEETPIVEEDILVRTVREVSTSVEDENAPGSEEVNKDDDSSTAAASTEDGVGDASETESVEKVETISENQASEEAEETPISKEEHSISVEEAQETEKVESHESDVEETTPEIIKVDSDEEHESTNTEEVKEEKETESKEQTEIESEEQKDTESEEQKEPETEEQKEPETEERKESESEEQKKTESKEEKEDSKSSEHENLSKSEEKADNDQDETEQATAAETATQSEPEKDAEESVEEVIKIRNDAVVEELVQEEDEILELRPRDHVNQILKLDDESSEIEQVIGKTSEVILKDLKRLYENAIKPLETLYKYRDLSNRHFGDAEIFSKPLILFMGPWSGGKSSIINYLLDVEYNETSLHTGAEPSPAYFNIIMHGEEPEILDGTELAADYTFSGLQKFGQGLEERLRGYKLPSKLLQKVNVVEIPGILEVRKQVSRVFPFNDACQWFIDRADIIFLVYDPSKLDVGPETEAILDQLKGREYQTRIVLNKADQVKPEELMRVQGALIWNISPLMSSAQPPVMYTTSLWSKPYESWAPVRLLQAQERAFLRDLRVAVEKRIDNKIASARRFAVRVRNHAKMVDCYLTTYYNHKSVFGNRKQVSDEIINHPQDYHIYEGLSTLTNISRYDLPDPDVYRDFFKLNALYEFQQLSATCTYFRGCPINRLDVAIAYDLPELVGKNKRLIETSLSKLNTATPES